MFQKTTIDYQSSGVLNKLALDYLSGKEELKAYYDYFPDKAGFKTALSNASYKQLDRKLLCRVLERQASETGNTSGPTRSNISLLGKETTYTVTTGHQLCLFTGPLYFIYKIITTINLAECLKNEHPGFDFIPVYWLAGEDHDFAEVNHFNLFGKKFEWESDQQGAVGDFSTLGLKELIQPFKAVLGESEYGNKLLNMFENAYLRHSTLAGATRYLVNELFGEYGLVTVDGNEKEFKMLFRGEFRKDIFDNIPLKAVNQTIHELKQAGYQAQVNPREINCFYYEKNLRARIEHQGDKFTLVGTDKTLSYDEMREIIENAPEKLSPNVTLRPCYQQQILPNLAYVGGPGELAYWLEYKAMFRALGLFFPALMPRNFITVSDKTTTAKINKLGFAPADFFRSEQDLIHDLQVKTNNIFEIETESEKIREIYSVIEKRLSATDKSLTGSLSAELQKAIKGLETISAKANRYLKQRSETEIAQIRSIRQKLFPGGVPQERHENFSSFYLQYGIDFIKSVKSFSDPFEHRQILLSE